MDEAIDSEQLAELECLLYSQIHHSIDVEPVREKISNDVSSTNQNSVGPPRYYIQSQPSMVPQKPPPLDHSADIPPLIQNVVPPPSNLFDHVQTYQVQQPMSPKQYYPCCQPPVNNIVFMTPSIPPLQPISNLTKYQRKKLNKQLRNSHMKLLQSAVRNAEVFRMLNQEDRAKVLKLQKKARYHERKKERLKFLKEQRLIEEYNNTLAEADLILPTEHTARDNSMSETQTIVQIQPMCTERVIELIETDDDDVVPLEENYYTIILSSDDESANKNETETKTVTMLSALNECDDDGSVQLIETPVAELIVLEPEHHPEPVAGPSGTKTDAQLMKPPSDTTDTSFSSADSTARCHNTNTPATPSRTSSGLALRPACEILNTPESSNDFLDHTLDTSQQNFNFSLHGGDLGAEKTFLKPRSRAEVYGSESSCSTSDISSSKNPMFNELEFDSPSKHLFGEVGLESFSEFITPRRKSGEIPSLLASSAGVDSVLPSQTTSISAQNRESNSDSTSSSESELEDEAQENTPQRKRLPSLSHFDVHETPAKSMPLAKTTKSNTIAKALNKFEFIRDTNENQTRGAEQAVAECRSVEKKNKKEKLSAGKSMTRKKEVGANLEENPPEGEPRVKNSDAEKGDYDKVHISEDNRKNMKRSQKSSKHLEVPSKNVGKGGHAQQPAKKIHRIPDFETIGSRIKSIRKRKRLKVDTEIGIAASLIPFQGSLKKKECMNTKTNNELDDCGNECQKQNTEEADDKSDEAQTKKKKCSECASESVTSMDTATTTEEMVESNAEGDSNQLNLSDVQIIEVPIECIDISDGEDKSCISVDTEKDTHFECTELEFREGLQTELSQANVENNEPYQTNEVTSESDVPPKSWCVPGFDVDAVWQSLPDDASKWKIMERDRIHIRLDSRGPRCKRCRAVGHYASDCPREAPVCYVCADPGHREPRCPNAVCTSCGKSTRFLTPNCGCGDHFDRCDLCWGKNHPINLCPDGWRRYHLTTEAGKVIRPNKDIFKHGKDRWCSGCNRRGHFEYKCNYLNRSHPPSTPFIRKYEDIYGMSAESKEPGSPNESDEPQDATSHEPFREHEDNEARNGAAVDHKEIVVSEKLSQAAYQLLDTERGKIFLQTILGDFGIRHTFNNKRDGEVTITCHGYPTDLIKVVPVLKNFIQQPGQTERVIKLSHKNWNILLSLMGQLKQLDSGFSQHCLDNGSRTLTFRGETFGTLLAEFDIRQAIEAERSKLTLEPEYKETFTTLRRNVPKDIVGHPHFAVLREKFSLECSIKGYDLTLIGSKQKIEQFLEDGINLRSPYLYCSYPLLKDFCNIVGYVDYPIRSRQDLKNLLAKQRYVILNTLFIGERLFPSLEMFQKLKRHIEVLKENIILSERVLKETKKILRSFEHNRGHRNYMSVITRKCLNKFRQFAPAEEPSPNIANLYNFDEDDSDIRGAVRSFAPLQPAQAKHLLETPEGHDFLSELNFNFPLELKEGDTRLGFYCGETQKAEAMKQIAFYFLIIDFKMPRTANLLYRKLLRMLANVKLDYYTTSCRELYEQLQQGTCSEGYECLHALLFAKHQFLDGKKHVATLEQYLGFLPPMGNAPLGIRDYRNLKTAALYLFCPVPMDVNYKWLISLVVTPNIPKICSIQHDELCALIKKGIRHGRDKVGNINDKERKIAELNVLDSYLSAEHYSMESLEIAALFLRDNFEKVSL